MDEALIGADLGEGVLAEARAVGDRVAVGLADGNVARRILVEQSVVEDDAASGFGDGAFN